MEFARFDLEEILRKERGPDPRKSLRLADFEEFYLPLVFSSPIQAGLLGKMIRPNPVWEHAAKHRDAPITSSIGGP